MKGSVYEGGIRVPLVARWPGHIAAGVMSDHLCALWDMLPTLMDVVGAGEKTPTDIDGISLAPTLLAGGDQPVHDHLYWEFAAYRGQQAVRWDRWKGVRQNMFQGNLVIELYDLQNDPGESNDVAAEHPEVVKKIEQLMQSERTVSAAFPHNSTGIPPRKRPLNNVRTCGCLKRFRVVRIGPCGTAADERAVARRDHRGMATSVLLYLDRFCVSFAADYIKEDLHLTQEQVGYFSKRLLFSYALKRMCRWGG